MAGVTLLMNFFHRCTWHVSNDNGRSASCNQIITHPDFDELVRLSENHYEEHRAGRIPMNLESFRERRKRMELEMLGSK